VSQFDSPESAEKLGEDTPVDQEEIIVQGTLMGCTTQTFRKRTIEKGREAG
jgi:hypothetical protein